MVERKLDFEDDKIRAWTFGSGEQELEKPWRDPTVMCVDVEREEVFESRIYRLRTSPEVLLYLVDLVTTREPESVPSPGAVVRFAVEMIDDTTFRFFAKRSREDGLISSLLVAVGGDDRCVLLQQEQVGEDEYRQAVQDFETSYLPEGTLTAPRVTTLEEWRRYSQEKPFSEEQPNPQGR